MTDTDGLQRFGHHLHPAHFLLDDRCTMRDGEILPTGVQGLVRLVIDQLRQDRARSMRTASLSDRVRGYEGVKMRNVEQYRAAIALGLNAVPSLSARTGASGRQFAM